MFDLIHMTLIKSGSTKMNKMKSQKNDNHMIWFESTGLGRVVLVLGGSKQPTRLVETGGYMP